MRLRDRRPADPEVNMTSFIDVILTLVLFFMFTTTFNRYSQLEVQLPEANAEQKQTEHAKVEITIDAQGRYFVNDQEVINTQEETLKRSLEKAVADQRDPIVILSADRKTPHQAVITAMDAARQLGLVHLTFATTNPAEGQ